MRALESAIGRTLLSLPLGLAERLVRRPITDGERTLDPRLQLLFAAQGGRVRPFEELGHVGSRSAYQSIVELLEIPQPPVAGTRDDHLDLPHGALRVRVHHPAAFDCRLPAVLYFHGGGFVIGDLVTHDHLCRRIARVTGAAVVAVDYRLAPEHPFPAAVDDCRAAIDVLREDAERFAIDPERIALAGDSAGGNLAAVVSPGLGLRFQLLYYPATDVTCRTESKRLFGRGFGLDGATMDWFVAAYSGGQSLDDPRMSPLRGDLARSPATRAVLAGFDVLRDEGRLYADALRAAGVDVELVERASFTHGFVHMTRLSGVADALDEDFRRLGSALASSAVPSSAHSE